MNTHSRPWLPHVTVASVTEKEGRFLMVEEYIDGRHVLNQPAGHLEPKENLADAMVRETWEETGWTVRPIALIGIYQWENRDSHTFIRFAFSAHPMSLDSTHQLDAGIVRAVWMTVGELESSRERHRSPEVWRAVTDYLAGIRHSLDTLHYRQ